MCWLFIAACVFSSFDEQGLPFIGEHWLLIVVASLIVEHRLSDAWASLVATRNGKVEEVLRDCCCYSVSKSCLTHCGPMDCSPPGSLSMGFSGQEYWSGLSFPSPGELPNPGIEPRSPAISGRFFTI